MRLKTISVFIFILISISFVSGKVVLPDIISDGMVLQRNENTQLWGKANPNSSVKIMPSWTDEHYVSESDVSGNWKVTIPIPKAGGPYSICFDDGETLEIDNILIGDVWFCSGQSNMEMPMKGFPGQPVSGGADIILHARKEQTIRICNITQATSLTELKYAEGRWGLNTPDNVANSSAVAYFFAKRINETTGVPIGIINASWGGTPIQTWMNKRTFVKKFPELIPADCNRDDEFKERPQDFPTTAFNAMVAPIIGYNIKGIIWYQGEKNRYEAALYRRLQPAYVGMMRELWHKPHMPFYYVQIAPYKYDSSHGFDAAVMREVQLLNMMEIPYSGMVVTMDIGDADCIHPEKKSEVGDRLALLALKNDYNHSGFDPNPPIVESWNIAGNKIIVEFNVPIKVDSSHDGFVAGLEIAGEDRKFYPAIGKYVKTIDSKKIEVSSSKVTRPAAVRYCFRNVSYGNIFNNYDIPASPFRTDSWNIDLE